jgi:dUTP pyrophosphatase
MGKVEVKVLLEDKMQAQVPEYKTAEACGADVRIVFNPDKPQNWHTDTCNGKLEAFTFLRVGETRLFNLGFRVEIPTGFELQLRSRSGMAKKGIFVINSPGTIDSDYRGPMMVLLHNAGDKEFTLKHQDRVAQLVLKRAPQAEFVLVNALSETERGEGGFGSTGVK